jgi:hypothetical protein
MLSKILKVIGMVLGGIVLGVLIAFVFGWFVRLLWNWLMPPIFGLPLITFWQAWGLVVLSHLLFKAGGHHPHHGDTNCKPTNWKLHFRDKLDRRLSGEKAQEAESIQ